MADWSLDDVQIAAPCSVDWDTMTGDERSRFCDKCGHHVFNLSQMTRDEAHALIFGTEERVCARLFRREDGAIMTSDCPQPAPPRGFLASRRARKKRRNSLPLPEWLYPQEPHPLSGIVARPQGWSAEQGTPAPGAESNAPGGEHHDPN